LTDERPQRDDFIRRIIREDLAAQKHAGIVTRFPPEPNGHIHIGNAMAVHLNFSVAEEFGGRCNLRFDDTNPVAEEEQYVRAIQESIRWLGWDWGDRLFYTSDYFGRLYEFAEELIRKGGAFVCDLSSEEILARRGTLTEPGIPSPYRDRSAEENLDLFRRMRDGAFRPGERVLRAKVDMASPVLPNRDPVIYRIIDFPHHRTGTQWKIYPMYDFSHCLSDALEGITHSLCSIEFVDHRPLYDWFLDRLDVPARPRQYEFAKFALTYTVLSKRNLKRLVDEGHVDGWDDPRMPTISGLRRRGVPPAALRNLYDDVGVTRTEGVVQIDQFEHHVRRVLNEEAPRYMGVLDPLKLVIENYPEDGSEELEAVNNPQDPDAGTRKVPFSRELWIERDDFLEDPPKKFFRMAPGREVRLRYAYLVTCTGVVKDEQGRPVELRCTYDPATRGGDAPDGRKVRGTIHWVSARHAVPAEVRLYDRLFTTELPTRAPEGQDFLANLNPHSLEVRTGVPVEPALAEAAPETRLQLERLGYFCVDRFDAAAGRPVLNRTVTLRDTWARIAGRSA